MQVLDLAKYLASTQDKVTPMKLQKLLFYVKAWGLVAGKELTDADFERWDYGPVNPLVYRAFADFRGRPIVLSGSAYVSEPAEEEKDLIDFISTCYGQYSALALSSMTHQEKPWQLTRPNEIISDELIEAYYSRQAFAKNFPFDPDKGPFYPVDSDGARAFTLDMSGEEAEQVRTYESYRAYLAQLQRAQREVDSWCNRLLA